MPGDSALNCGEVAADVYVRGSELLTKMKIPSRLPSPLLTTRRRFQTANGNTPHPSQSAKLLTRKSVIRTSLPRGWDSQDMHAAIRLFPQ